MKHIADKYSGKQTGPIAEDGKPPWPGLPPRDTVRWFAGRKAQVVAAVQAGTLTVSQVCQLYGLSPEEFREWQRHCDRRRALH